MPIPYTLAVSPCPSLVLFPTQGISAMANSHDHLLADYVQKEIASGKQEIMVPLELSQHASNETIQEMRSLCKLSGVSIKGL